MSAKRKRGQHDQKDLEEQSQDDIYNTKVKFGMSGAAVATANEMASEPNTKPQPDPDDDDDDSDLLAADTGSDGHSPALEQLGNEDSDDAEQDIMTSEAPFTGEENLGEQDVLGGSEPAPESGAEDVGEWMKRAVGRDPDRNMDNPQEVSLDKIDEDEEALRTS